MGYTKGKVDITGIVWLAMFGSLYVTSDKKQEEEKGTKKSTKKGKWAFWK